MTPFIPHRRDVHRTRALLHYRLGLPTELVLDILDKAHYWVEFVHEDDRTRLLLDEGFSHDFSAAQPLLGIMLDTPEIARRETSKLREIEFLIVSHDQGWTTEDTIGTFKTSSWFEVSIVRPPSPLSAWGVDEYVGGQIYEHTFSRSNIHTVTDAVCEIPGMKTIPRPSSTTEPQRLHCAEMHEMTFLHDDPSQPMGIEGQHAWYLQGNEVARATSVFEGDYVRRYRVVWGCRNNPAWEGNEGAGRGENFIDSLKHGDWICVWARAKRRGWENHVHGIRVTMRYTV